MELCEANAYAHWCINLTGPELKPKQEEALSVPHPCTTVGMFSLGGYGKTLKRKRSPGTERALC